MLAQAVRRLALAIPTLFAIIAAAFVLMHLAPGGPFTSERQVPAEIERRLEAEYGLNLPVEQQLLRYLFGTKERGGGLIRGDLGPSMTYKDKNVGDIIAEGAPVYGINTGFGKLAQVRIGVEDLSVLQRNIVLSHAAGTGDPMPRAVVRLMMALKLSSLGQGASGVRFATIEMLEMMLARDCVPVIPAQGSVGASGDLAPLAHLAAPSLPAPRLAQPA